VRSVTAQRARALRATPLVSRLCAARQSLSIYARSAHAIAPLIGAHLDSHFL